LLVEAVAVGLVEDELGADEADVLADEIGVGAALY
jgi:hypothetical protein